MNNLSIALLVIYLLVNLFAFMSMLVDKVKSARPDSARISEGVLFFMATAFGSVGVYAGMFAFRHKTRKWYFLVGIPMMIVQNVAFLYLIYLFITQNYGGTH
jgi:uncharacterized membrane protein YsdA (DUF1294 family)